MIAANKAPKDLASRKYIWTKYWTKTNKQEIKSRSLGLRDSTSSLRILRSPNQMARESRAETLPVFNHGTSVETTPGSGYDLIHLALPS